MTKWKIGIVAALTLAFAAPAAAQKQTVHKEEASILGAGMVEPEPVKPAEPARKFTAADQRAMQQHLVKSGYLKRASNRWHGGARKAMREWQKANGLAVTGRINAESFAYVEQP